MLTKKSNLIFLLTLYTFFIVVVSNVNSNAKVIYVNMNNPDNFSKIQDAIDNASDFDEIYVYNGTYFENLVINKSITLIGENKDSTIIDANYSYYGISLSNSIVNVSGFTIKNAIIGIYVSMNLSSQKMNSMINLFSNTIKNNNIGIYIEKDILNITLINNIIDNNTAEGIQLFGTKNVNALSNKILHNKGFGLSLWNSSNNTIKNNIVTNSLKGVFLGELSCFNIIENNDILKNSNSGIFFDNASYNTLDNNNFSSNDRGLSLYNSNYNLVANNKFNNNRIGIFLDASNENDIDNNTFLKNEEDLVKRNNKFETPDFELFLVFSSILIIFLLQRRKYDQ